MSQLIARGQATIHTQQDSYTITQSVGEYIFPAEVDGTISEYTTFQSKITVTAGNERITDFTIGQLIGNVEGFDVCSVDQSEKTIEYLVFPGNGSLADSGIIEIPIIIEGVTYSLTFKWSKVRNGAQGKPGVDRNLLDWVQDWESGKTQINGESIITPKLFAGIKNASGTITGTAIGKFSLLTRNASGQYQTEEINGIYGFSDGYKTFAIDTTGSVELGRGTESIKYNAATGKIEFGSAVKMLWVGATYIDANGIFTGTLSATTVSAVNINASQITAGTINANRIDVASLKAQLITATNIEALTLNVTKGKIGGWNLDADSIFKGTKNNAVNSFTAASGSITIGSNGIRGYKWRLESNGAGALAGGNILWDANGNVTFGSSVSLYWKNEAQAALNDAKIYADQKDAQTLTTAQNDATTKADAAKELAQAMAYGRMLYRDPTFYKGVNGIRLYSNTSVGVNVSHERLSDTTAPNDSKFVLRIRNVGVSSPNCGGFTWGTGTQYRKVFITRLIAKIPVGRAITFHTNTIGTGGKQSWLTSTAGTGDWAEYICKVQCGTSNFSTTHFFTMTGAFGSATAPVDWFLAYATVFDITSTEKLTTTIDADGIYTGILTAQQINAVSIDATSIKTGFLSADRIAAGTIKAEKLDATSIKASIINTDYINGLTLNFQKGLIGGWTIAEDYLYSGNLAYPGTGAIQIRNSTTGTGYIYNGGIRPHGFTITWNQSWNAGHIVMGQVLAPASVIKTGFYGIQMMSHDDLEYFILSANTSRSGSKEVYNRIAGWAFDHQKIWKNNVSLGFDGSIANGTKWKLNNDGSGQVAAGNISWNAAGAVTFSSAVSALWEAAVNNGELYVRGTGANNASPAQVILNNKIIHTNSLSGMSLTIINRSTLALITNIYMNLNGAVACNSMANELNSLDSSVIVILTSYGTIQINATLNAAIQRCGGPDITLTSQPLPYAFVGIPGIGKNNGLTVYTGTTVSDSYAEISTKIINGLPEGFNVGSKQRTYIDAWGIYTGTLTANQVNTVGINASSITTGTLNAARIAAGSITVDKLDVATLKATLITAANINALTLTVNKGTIGGWIINSSAITSSTGNIVLDNANKRIAVLGSGATSTSGARVMIHYTSASNYGLQVLNSSNAILVNLGYTNYIGGWNIGQTYLYKGSVYLGSDGSIYNSSNRWRLNNDGSGSIASGNISWTAAGAVTFGSSVSLQWQTGIDLANDLARAMAFGVMLYRAPEFFMNGATHWNNTSQYMNNSTRTLVSVADSPNSSKYVMRNTVTGWNTASDLRAGGFYFVNNNSRSNAIFITRIIAKIPVGRTIQAYHNNYGTGGTTKWLTSQAGTGKWDEYICKVTCGATGTFATINYFALTGGDAPTASVPLVWDVAYATVFDITASEKYMTTIDVNGIYTGKISAGQINVDTSLIVGGSTYNGSVLVRNASNSTMVTLDRTGITAIAGKIGGWTLTSSYLYSGSVYIHSNGSIYNSSYWKLNANGSGSLANGKFTWDSAGNITAQGGTFKDVKIQGTIRNPFVKYDPSIYVEIGGGSSSSWRDDMSNNDNIVVVGATGGWSDPNPTIPWNLEQSGRRLCIINYKWTNSAYTGNFTLNAPTNQPSGHPTYYFFEDGQSKKSISFNREVVELIGYGCTNYFYGWVVVNRRDIMPTYKRGTPSKHLAMGVVTCTSTTAATVKYKTFDGYAISVTHTGKGVFNVYLPWGLGADKYMVILTGRVSIDATPIDATIRYQYSSYFTVWTHDDSSLNDGSFNFMVVSTDGFV